jgi:hypothetical protein
MRAGIWAFPVAATGADVVSLDCRESSYPKDAAVCAREGLNVRRMQGDMADLGCLSDACFDLVLHPAPNVFVPDVETVWCMCFPAVENERKAFR